MDPYDSFYQGLDSFFRENKSIKKQKLYGKLEGVILIWHKYCLIQD